MADSAVVYTDDAPSTIDSVTPDNKVPRQKIAASIVRFAASIGDQQSPDS